ncbi:MAG: polysaccharide deacetylase family protein [Bacteroidota bacterium]
MKQELLGLLHRFAGLLPLPLLIRLTGKRLFLPFYHAVQGKQTLPHIQSLYQVRTARQFEADLDYLLRYFQPVDMDTLAAHLLHGKALPTKAFMLSFDDGLKEVYEVAAPILKRKGLAATVFVNSAFVDNQALFFRYKASLLIDAIEGKAPSTTVQKRIEKQLKTIAPLHSTIRQKLLSIRFHQSEVLDQIAATLEFDFEAFLKEKQPYLSRVQLEALVQQGFSIGAHSIDHPLYEELSLDQQIDQTQESVHFVRDHFHPNFKSFAFPFSDHGVKQPFFDYLAREKITDLTFGCAGLKEDSAPRHLQRYPMERYAYDADKLVPAEYFYYLVKALFRKNRIKR